ncbi:MAG: hydrogenase maturation nickel metallochaperone HypA [Chitinophagales bacterium]
MHELSIAQSILAIAENAAPKNKAVVTGVSLQIGQLSGIEIEPLKFALSVIKENTILQDADLDIEIIKGEAECTICKTVFPMDHFGSSCPQCGSYFVKVLKGREMKVINLTVNE